MFCNFHCLGTPKPSSEQESRAARECCLGTLCSVLPPTNPIFPKYDDWRRALLLQSDSAHTPHTFHYWYRRISSFVVFFLFLIYNFAHHHISRSSLNERSHSLALNAEERWASFSPGGKRTRKRTNPCMKVGGWREPPTGCGLGPSCCASLIALSRSLQSFFSGSFQLRLLEVSARNRAMSQECKSELYCRAARYWPVDRVL